MLYKEYPELFGFLQKNEEKFKAYFKGDNNALTSLKKK
jgi:hypothetical protein